MVEDEVPSDGATQALPDQENVDLADRLMERFQPEGGQGLNAMLSNRAKSGAMVLAGLGFFIWITVFFNLDSTASSDDTILLNFAFHNIAIVVALLSFLAAIFSELGSERGRAAPSLMAGPMQFFAIIYVFEPLATGAMGDALTVEEGLWRAPVEAGHAARRGGGRQLAHVVAQVVERRGHDVGESAAPHAAALRQCQAAQASA